MIASVQAIYDGTKDHVEAAVHLLEDDGTSSLHRLIKSANVTLMHDRYDMQVVSFDNRAYNQKWNKFFIFFLHPPIQRHMQIRLDVVLLDGRTATDRAPIIASNLLNDPNQLQNPSLAGRPLTDFTGGHGFELL